jgi:hypothetical protein
LVAREVQGRIVERASGHDLRGRLLAIQRRRCKVRVEVADQLQQLLGRGAGRSRSGRGRCGKRRNGSDEYRDCDANREGVAELSLGQPGNVRGHLTSER